MSRKDEFKVSSNPAQKFLEWKSEEKCFGYYDREKSERALEKLPFKFLVLKELHSVKGWNDESESGIFANDVAFIGTEVLEVKSFKGGKIAKGLYKDIKADVNAAGGHYVKSIYAMIPNGSVVHLTLKGSVVREWGEFTKSNRDRLGDEWVEVKGVLEFKKGRVKYTTPEFKFAKTLTDKECVSADEAYDKVDAYVSKPKLTEVKVEADQVEHEEDDLPF